MKHLPKDFPDVERMPEKAWQRVEDTVFERLDRETATPMAFNVRREPERPTRRWLSVVGFAAAAAAVAAMAVVSVTGGGGDDATPATMPPEPIASSRIVTDTDNSEVSLGEATLDIAPESAVVVSGNDDRGMLVVLERGSVDCAVPPREGRPAFIVRAGGVHIRVVGTRFTVARDADSAVVEVTEGTVEVTADGERTLVHAGEVWWQPVDDDDTSDDADTASPERPEPRKRRRKARVERREAAPSVAPAAAPSRATLYNDAARIEAADPGRAIETYRELARGTDTWAKLGLYAHARLEADRGNKKRARRLLTNYLDRFPNGPNAADARALREQLH